MEDCYEVYHGNTAAGKVQLIRQGLYCRVICRCRIPEEMVCRLFAQTDHGRENLGVLVPEGEGFVLDRKIPSKRLPGGKLRFFLSSGSTDRKWKLVAVCPEEPFLYIDRLQNAFLETDHGKVCVRIEDPPEAV